MIQVCKIPSPQAIFNGFCIVTMKVLNSYETGMQMRYSDGKNGGRDERDRNGGKHEKGPGPH